MTRFPFSVAETDLACLENITAKIGGFLQAIRPDVEALARMHDARPDVEASLAGIAEVLVEDLRSQFPEAFEAVSERWDFVPSVKAPEQRKVA